MPALPTEGTNDNKLLRYKKVTGPLIPINQFMDALRTK